MCVIMIAETEPPHPNQVEQMHRANPHGMGIAWREGGKVHWRKGLMSPDAQLKEMEGKPFPYVCHWRVPSIGPDIAGLNHPFTIDDQASTALEGETDGWLLMHNGHWGKWKDVLFETIARTPGLKLPVGKWSDSRALAFIAAQYGLGYLEFVGDATGNRLFAFGPGEDECEIFGDGWVKKANPTIWVSNTHWEFRAITPHGRQGWTDHRGIMGRNDVNDHRANKDVWDKVGDASGSVKVDDRRRVSADAASGGTSQMAPFRTSQDAIREQPDVKDGVEEVRHEGPARGSGRDSEDHSAAAPSVQATSQSALMAEFSWACALNPKPSHIAGERLALPPATRYAQDIAAKRERIKAGLAAAKEDRVDALKSQLQTEVDLENSMRRQRIEDHKRGITHLGSM